jgi:hypothetical protein
VRKRRRKGINNKRRSVATASRVESKKDGWSKQVAASKKERERLREAMSRSHAASPKRKQEIAEMIKGQCGARDINSERVLGAGASVIADGYISDDGLEKLRAYEASQREQRIVDEIIAGKHNRLSDRC